ncbi:MAG TPA: hypothetical protein VNT99_10135 [Methylomirabilota bacterium]|nr:hypothetical protein [Methylomirabilota bacterium]
MNSKDDPKKLVGEVQVFRIRIAAAESKLKILRQQARQAKRRRKAAKLVAQRARKQFKRFKAGLAELQQALAEAEVKLFQAGGRALARKMAKSKPGANRVVNPSKESKIIARKPRPALPRQPKRVARKKPAITEAQVVSNGPADAAALDHTQPTPQSPEPPGVNL